MAFAMAVLSAYIPGRKADSTSSGGWFLLKWEVSDERRTDTTQGQMQSAPAGLDSYLAPAGIVARAKICRCAARNILIGGISAGPVAIVDCSGTAAAVAAADTAA